MTFRDPRSFPDSHSTFPEIPAANLLELRPREDAQKQTQHGMPWHAMACHAMPWHAMACHVAPTCGTMPWEGLQTAGLLTKRKPRLTTGPRLTTVTTARLTTAMRSRPRLKPSTTRLTTTTDFKVTPDNAPEQYRPAVPTL